MKRLVFLASLLCGLPAHAQVILNGSFESVSAAGSPTYLQIANPGNPSPTATCNCLDDWQPVGNGVEWIHASNLGIGPAADGEHYLDLTLWADIGHGIAGIEHNIDTNISDRYTISFAASSSTAHGRNGTGQVIVNVAGTSHTFNLNTPTAALDWQYYEVTFTATSAVTNLQFTTTTNEHQNFTFIDDVSFPGPVAEELRGAIVLSADTNMISGLDPSLTTESVGDLAIRPNGAPQFFENLLDGRASVFVDQYSSSNRGVRGANEQIRNFYGAIATVSATAIDGGFTAIDLQGVDLLISNVPTVAYTSAELSAMGGLLSDGGTIMFLGGEGQNFHGSTTIINSALSFLGSSMILEDNFIAVAGWPHLTTSIAPHPLMSGVNDMSIAVSGSVANGTPLAFWTEVGVEYVVLAVDGVGTGPCAGQGGDADGDGVCDQIDNCPADPNADQADLDFDGAGDECDFDIDGDGVDNSVDNCQTTPNPDQTDTDLDGEGDTCDTDDDGDGELDDTDNCPLVVNPDQTDNDGDGLGDACDADLDGDGIGNSTDNCPAFPNPFQEDTDGDGIGDDCDVDDDNDMVCDINADSLPDCNAGPDNCPVTSNTDQLDFDNDGIGDACDADLDGDGIGNDVDNCSLTPNPSQDDTDNDGSGDACDSDDDNDGVEDTADNCPFIVNPDQSDADGDGAGDSCDSDLDGDGVGNTVDNCPVAPNANQLDTDGDGVGDACDDDIDDDGVSNSADQCAATPSGESVDPANGCSIAQLCPCDGPRGTTTPWKNHGKYVSCTAHASEDFVDLGLITEAEKDAIMSVAGSSSCGKKN